MAKQRQYDMDYKIQSVKLANEPYYYGGQTEYYDDTLDQISSFTRNFPMISVLKPFNWTEEKTAMEAGVDEKTVEKSNIEKVIPVEEITIDELYRSIFFEGRFEELVERIPLCDILLKSDTVQDFTSWKVNMKRVLKNCEKESDIRMPLTYPIVKTFYHYLSKGAIPPHLPESNEQNLIVIEAFLEAAKRYARGGYDVIVDGIVGPWFLEPWLNIVQEHYEVHYIVLRASKEETMKRAIERSKLDRETNIELVETMWNQFSNLGIYELNVIDTTTHSIKDTVSAVKEKIVSGTALLF